MTSYASLVRSTKKKKKKGADKAVLGFEETFASEIEVFMPPQQSRETPALSVTPSPTWRRPSPSITPTPPKGQPNGISHRLGSNRETVSDETTVKSVKPISVRAGRGARLSFLGGKKNTAAAQTGTTKGETAGVLSYRDANGEAYNHSHDGIPDTENNNNKALGGRSRSHSKETSRRRSGLFRTHTNETGHSLHNSKTNNGEEYDNSWAKETEEGFTGAANHLERKESAGQRSVESTGGAMRRRGSVRKRLSLLKLGKKPSKGNGLMGSVYEE